MRARSRIRVALAALAVGVLPAVAPLVPSDALAAEVRSGGLEGYGACLAAGGAGDLLILVDESASLVENDPEDARVTASTYLLDRLAGATATGGVTLDVSVAAFSDDVTTVLDWTPLDAGGLDAARSAVAGLAERDNGLETDYWNALEGSRRSLADRAAASDGGSRCQAVAWFSDGALDLEPRSTAARRDALPATKPYAPDLDLRTPEGAAAGEAAARDSLCRAGGLADQVRASGIWTLGIGLAAGTSQAQDFSLMQSIATGADAAGTSCGALLDPVPGDFSLATDIDELLFAFDRIAAPGQTGADVTAGVCQGAVCTDQAHRFVLDASIGSVHVLGFSDVPGVRVALLAPDGVEWSLDRSGTVPPTSGAGTGAAVSWTWFSDRTVAVDLTPTGGAPGWSGQWSLVFVDDSATSPTGTSRSNIRIEGDLLPTLTAPDAGPLHVGEAVPGFRLGLANRTGAAVAPESLLGTVSLSAVLVAPDGQERPIADALTAGQLADALTVDLAGIPPGEALVRLTLGVTTAPAPLPDGSVAPGTALATQRVDVPLSLVPPPDFPTVGPRVDFGRTEGAADLTAVLPVTGPGCVWLRSTAVVAAPAEAGTVTVSAGDRAAADTCLEVAEGQTIDLPLDLATTDAGNGSVNGTLTVALAPVGEPERATAVEVPFTADLRKPLNPVTALGAFLAALLLGPGIPLGLLYLLKRSGARIPARGLSGRTIPVTVTDSQLLRDGAPFALRDDDFVQLVPLGARGARQVAVDGVTLRTRVGWSPFGAGTVRVDAPGRVGATPANPVPVGAQGQAELPLAVHNTWAVLVDPAAPAEQAQVLVLVGADSPPQRRAEVADDVARTAPGLIRGLRTRADGDPASRTGGSVRPPTATPAPFPTAEGDGEVSGGSARPGTGAGPATRRDPFDFSSDDEDGPR